MVIGIYTLKIKQYSLLLNRAAGATQPILETKSIITGFLKRKRPALTSQPNPENTDTGVSCSPQQLHFTPARPKKSKLKGVMGMLRTDKNGKQIKTGDIVKIEGGYFKADNGTFLVKCSPGDPNWNGSEYSLRKCNKKGEESNAKYSISFWPLMITINSYDKRLEAKRHNAEHATIEVIGSVKIYELNVKQSRGWNDYEYRELATESRYKELLTYSHTKVEVIKEVAI